MSDADWATEQYAPCVCGHQRRNCTCHLARPIAAFEAGLRREALEHEAHPFKPYTCPDCGRGVRSLEWDGRCRPCGDPDYQKGE